MTSPINNSELLGLLAHEMKSPIGILRWHMEMVLAGDYGPITEAQRTIFLEMQQESARASHLLREFLQMSLTPASGKPLQTEEVHISDLCTTILTELRGYIQRYHPSIISDVSPTDTLRADPSLLSLILHTLLENACKYAPSNGIITTHTEKTADTFTFSIKNHGISLTPEEQKQVYEKSHRSAHARSVDPEGTGLGLYLMKSVVENTGGQTWCTSDGQDTIFSVSYPLTGMSIFEETV